jgi:hypothetical protein
VHLTVLGPAFPVVVVVPNPLDFEVVETLSLPTVPLVVVLPKLSVFDVVFTFCPSHMPVVVVFPKLSVREVVVQAACDTDRKVICPAITSVAMTSARFFIFLE